MKLLFLLLLGNVLPLHSADITYIGNNNKEIRETITSTSNGLIYDYQEGAKSSHLFILTNENHSTLSFTHTTKQRTNNFYLFEGSLVSVQKGKQKITKLEGLELILLPEIQLQNFIQNKELTTMRYMTLRLETCKAYVIQTSKVPDMITNINNTPHTMLEISYEGVSPNIIRFVYYFDPNGIASKKEGYFNGARKPQFNLIKQ